MSAWTFSSAERCVRRSLVRGWSLDPWRSAAAGERLTGTLPLRGMPRLCEAAGLKQQHDGQALYELECHRDTQGTCRITLVLSAEIRLVCQRCLGGMPWALSRQAHLVVGASFAEAGDCEPVEMDASGHIEINTLIEEEILLSMPFAPKHPQECC